MPMTPPPETDDTLAVALMTPIDVDKENVKVSPFTIKVPTSGDAERALPPLSGAKQKR
jgi:hypothetical protein